MNRSSITTTAINIDTAVESAMRCSTIMNRSISVNNLDKKVSGEMADQSINKLVRSISLWPSPCRDTREKICATEKKDAQKSRRKIMIRSRSVVVGYEEAKNFFSSEELIPKKVIPPIQTLTTPQLRRCLTQQLDFVPSATSVDRTGLDPLKVDVSLISKKDPSKSPKISNSENSEIKLNDEKLGNTPRSNKMLENKAGLDQPKITVRNLSPISSKKRLGNYSQFCIATKKSMSIRKICGKMIDINIFNNLNQKLESLPSACSKSTKKGTDERSAISVQSKTPFIEHPSIEKKVNLISAQNQRESTHTTLLYRIPQKFNAKSSQKMQISQLLIPEVSSQACRRRLQSDGDAIESTVKFIVVKHSKRHIRI